MALGELQHYVRFYDDDLDAETCQRLVSTFESLGRFQRYNGRGVRAGLEESGWHELNISRLADEGFRGMFRRRIDLALARYNADIGLSISVPNSPQHSDLVMKRYRSGGQERFQLHFDAINHVANRYLVVLWYLNDVSAGGETRFPQLQIAIPPRAGRLLIFPPFWMYQHEGVAPASGCKYILSTYLLFPMPQAS